MSGGSNSTSSSTTNGLTQKWYTDTTTSNPYFNSRTNNAGTQTTFAPNSAQQQINDYFNNNVNGLLNEYRNPSLNSVTNQAKMNAFRRGLNEQTGQSLTNDIINPLAQRNMLRSSSANDMYSALSKQNAKSIADYQDNLLANSQNDTANMINSLYNMYAQGYNMASGNQAQSLQSSSGNGMSLNFGTRESESTAK